MREAPAKISVKLFNTNVNRTQPSLCENFHQTFLPLTSSWSQFIIHINQNSRWEWAWWSTINFLRILKTFTFVSFSENFKCFQWAMFCLYQCYIRRTIS